MTDLPQRGELWLIDLAVLRQHVRVEIRPDMTYGKRRVEVGGLSIATVDDGSGDPIVFLHGNPTSSFLWRNVIPHVEHLGRCIAPDLIGFGDSDKLAESGPGSYRFVENRLYLDRLLKALGVAENVTWVVHDWGSGLGFDWARRHPDAVAGIAYLEANVAPRSWSQLSPAGREFFERLRSAEGEHMALVDNVFIEEVLPNGVTRDLAEAELAEYRRPFASPGEGRRPTLRGRGRSPSTASPPTCIGSSLTTRSGWRSRWCRNCSSMCPTATRYGASCSTSLAPFPTRPKSVSLAVTSPKRTAHTRSARHSPTGFRRYDALSATEPQTACDECPGSSSVRLE